MAKKAFDPRALTASPVAKSSLNDAHREELQSGSGIDKKTIRARGYSSVADPQVLINDGYSKNAAQRHVPCLRIPIFGPDGHQVGVEVKPDDPKPDKRTGKVRKYEKATGSRNAVNVHPALAGRIGDVEVDLWITEGTKKGDAAVSRGLCCVSLSGVDNWVYKPQKDAASEPCPEWEGIPLKDRAVYVAYDSDTADNPRVQQARRKLTVFLKERGAKEVLWVDLVADSDGGKVGLDDFFVASGTVEQLQALGRVPAADELKKSTQGQTVVDLVQANYDLFSTTQGEAMALPKNGVRLPVVFPESGGKLTAEVRDTVHRTTGKVLGKSSVSDAMGIVHTRALNGPRVSLHLRCASFPDKIVIDLAEPKSARCIVITAEGWSVEDEPPEGIYFKRTGTMQALPEPKRGAKKGAGWKALSKITGWKLTSRNFLLARSWLVVAPLAHIQRPMLLLVGAPGSAKSARGLALVGVWDPREALGSSFGKNLDDDRVKASSQFLLGYDNLSKVSEAQSDHICRAVTGDAPEKRRLYSDDDLYSTYYRRTGVFTAVNLPSGFKADALERLIPLELHRIEKFKSETALREQLVRAQPAILGDALDDLVIVLAGLGDDDGSEITERMADYWLALKALGPEYAEAYSKHNREGMLEVALNDPWIQSVIGWVKGLDGQHFKGSPQDGYVSYMEYAIDGVVGGGNADTSRRPRDAKSLARAMQQNATPLWAAGVRFDLGRSNGKRRWEVSWTE